MADALSHNAVAIKEANARDMEAAARMGLNSAMLDRLKLDDQRIAGMAGSGCQSGISRRRRRIINRVRSRCRETA